MEVILRPLTKNTWAGVKGDRYKNCSSWIGTYFTRNGALHTGFEKPDGTLDYETADRLTVALHKEPKSLYPSSDFWNTFYVRMGRDEIKLDTSRPEDELKYLFLKTHKRVQDGYAKPNPSANFILINFETEAKEFNKVARDKRKAMKEFDKLSTAEMKKVLRLYGQRSDNLSAELVENKLFELIDKDPSKFFDKWIDNKRRETEWLLQEAISKNVIRKNKSEYKYGNDTVGHTLDDAIIYLDDPQHRDLKSIIINEVNNKM
jgi:hypothetical protein